jgi:hypothetical protein
MEYADKLVHADIETINTNLRKNSFSILMNSQFSMGIDAELQFATIRNREPN